MKRKLNEHDVPEPINSGDAKTSTKTTKSTFATLNLDPRLLQAVKKYKFSSPTPVQTKAIPLILEGKDVLARAKTGSGKTLAYLLPILHSILHRKAANKRSKSTSTLVLVPTKELANQVNTTVQDFTAFCVGEIKCENINRTQDAAVTKARLADKPDIVVGTPAQAVQWNNQEALKLDDLKHLIIDEADLTISYQHEDALEVLATSLPTGLQKIMTSATLSTEVDTVSRLFFEKGEGAGPVILDLSEEEAAEKPTLAQYTFPTAEDEKFLLIYTIFKLQLIRGKVIVFVADIDRCYRVKLFLEQFGIRSCVLNSELPVNSRLHVVEEFNRGVYDIIVAADDGEVVGVEEAKSANRKRRRLEKQAEQEEEQENGENEEEWEGMAEGGEGDQPERKDSHTSPAPAVQSPGKKERKPRNDREYGVSRGIDFRYVTCVLNFDMPTTSKSYTHRIGRTARAGQTGMALSFYVPHDQFRKHKPTSIPQCENDEKVLEKIMKKQAENGNEVKEWGLDRTKLEGFRYRLADALRAVTRIAVREARTKELRSELIKSEKLKRHFEENPDDLRHLRHDTESHAVRQQPHLKHVPDYLLPSGGKAAVSKDVGFVGMRKDKENRIRKARAFNKSRGKGRLAKGKGLDPLKSLNVKGRGKK